MVTEKERWLLILGIEPFNTKVVSVKITVLKWEKSDLPSSRYPPKSASSFCSPSFSLFSLLSLSLPPLSSPFHYLSPAFCLFSSPLLSCLLSCLHILFSLREHMELFFLFLVITVAVVFLWDLVLLFIVLIALHPLFLIILFLFSSSFHSPFLPLYTYLHLCL